MKLLILAFLFILQSCGTTAEQKRTERDEELLLQQTPVDNLRTQELNAYPDMYLSDDSILSDTDKETGLVEDAFYTGNDSSRFSISLNYSQDYEDPTKVQMYDFQYFSKINSSYLKLWWGFQAKQVIAKYSAIAEESVTDTLATARKSNNQSFSIFGFGLGHRFRALGGAMLSDRFFENISVFANYMFHTDTTTSETYNGYGYTAEYGLNYRSSKTVYYGGKLSYNWAMVERSAVDEESLPERSLVFGWLTLGLELGYYF